MATYKLAEALSVCAAAWWKSTGLWPSTYPPTCMGNILSFWAAAQCAELAQLNLQKQMARDVPSDKSLFVQTVSRGTTSTSWVMTQQEQKQARDGYRNIPANRQCTYKVWEIKGVEYLLSQSPWDLKKSCNLMPKLEKFWLFRWGDSCTINGITDRVIHLLP